MATAIPSEVLIASVQGDLDRLGASCRVAQKSAQGQRWVTFREGLASFREALDVARDREQPYFEIGIVLEHPKFGGVIIWTTQAPQIANRFDRLLQD